MLDDKPLSGQIPGLCFLQAVPASAVAIVLLLLFDILKVLVGSINLVSGKANGRQ